MLSAAQANTDERNHVKELEEVIENCNAPGEISPASQTVESVSDDDITPLSLRNLESPINRRVKNTDNAFREARLKINAKKMEHDDDQTGEQRNKFLSSTL